MNHSLMQVRKLSEDTMKPYLGYIPVDEIPEIMAGEAGAIGIDTVSGIRCGVMIFGYCNKPDEDNGKVLIIKKMYLDDKYRDMKTIGRVVTDTIGQAKSFGDPDGIAFQTLYPEDYKLEKVLPMWFTRIDDGNTVYEIPIHDIGRHHIFRREADALSASVKRVDLLDKKEYEAFMRGWDGHFPPGLSPSALPGRWLKELSFVRIDAGEAAAYILTSELSAEMLYVGAIYSEKRDKVTAGALIAALGREVMKSKAYKKVMFAAATDEGKKLCEYMTRDIENVKKSEIHYYYMEV